MIQNDINLLVEPFRLKAKVFLAVARKKYPNISPFETLRSYQRQLFLFAKGAGVTRTMKSKHREGKAMDIVFMKGKTPTRKGDYNFIHYIGDMCGMDRLKRESCHLQDDGKSIIQTMAGNSARRGGADETTKNWLKIVNDEFRKNLPATK